MATPSDPEEEEEEDDDLDPDSSRKPSTFASQVGNSERKCATFLFG